MALTDNQKRRIKVYEYLITRLQRHTNQYTPDDFLNNDRRVRYHVLVRKICNFEYKIKQIKNNNPENGLSVEFDYIINGD